MRNNPIITAIFLTSLILGMFSNTNLTISPISLLEKAREAEFILHVRILNIESEQYGKNNYFRFANYEVVEVLKGNYNEHQIRVDFKKVNSNIVSVTYPYAKAKRNEEAVLFLNKDKSFVKANQGKANVDEKGLIEIRRIVKYSLDFANGNEHNKVLETISLINTFPSQHSSLFRELNKVDNNKYGVEISVLLDNEDPFVQIGALSTLKGTRIKSLVPVIIKYSKHQSPDIRKTAARVLGSMDDDTAEDALRILTKDENEDVRTSAIISFPRTDENKNLLINSLKDPSAKVRYAGLNSLRDLQSKESTDAIINILDDSDRGVRNKAFETIAYYATPEAIGALTKALMSDDTEIQRRAIAAISHQSRNFPNSMNDPKIIDLINGIVNDTNEMRQKMVGIRALGYLKSNKALPVLKDNLTDVNPRIRVTAARSIVNINGFSLIEYMEDVLENEEDERVARQLKKSISALKESKSRSE